jgi:hypothetical protein
MPFARERRNACAALSPRAAALAMFPLPAPAPDTMARPKDFTRICVPVPHVQRPKMHVGMAKANARITQIKARTFPGSA